MYQRNNNCPSLISHTHLNTCVEEGRQPLMLKCAEWTDIAKHSTQNDDSEHKKRLAAEAEYNQYLKTQSQAMMESWDNTVEKKVAKRNASRLQLQRDKFVTGQQLYKEMTETDRKHRKELLDYAHDMMQHLKAGPQQLENAFNLTELIEQQRVQREQRAEAAKRDRMNYLADGAKQMKQSQEWIQEQIEHTNARMANCLDYKAELARQIQLREKERNDQKQRQLEEEKIEHEALHTQYTTIMSDEKQALQKKRENVHRNSLESFRLKQQRQLRDVATNRTEDDRIRQYLQAKNEQETTRKLTERERKWRRARAVEDLGMKVLRSLPDIQGAEEKSYQNAIKVLASQWDEQECKRRAHTARLRDERIAFQQREQKELEEQRQKELAADEEIKTNRMRNEELNLHHDIQKRSERTKKNIQLKKVLREQVDERKLRERMAITDDSKFFREENRKDDEHFMEYAEKLLNYATQRGRVLRPLLKVIDEYQEKHSLLPPRIELPHLHSQVGIGVAEKEFVVRTRKHGVKK